VHHPLEYLDQHNLMDNHPDSILYCSCQWDDLNDILLVLSLITKIKSNLNHQGSHHCHRHTETYLWENFEFQISNEQLMFHLYNLLLPRLLSNEIFFFFKIKL